MYGSAACFISTICILGYALSMAGCFMYVVCGAVATIAGAGALSLVHEGVEVVSHTSFILQDNGYAMLVNNKGKEAAGIEIFFRAGGI